MREPVLLPSKGLLYPKSWTQDGKMKVKPMTVKEEEILSTARLLREGKAIDMVLTNCLEVDDPDFDVKNLLSGDRSFLLYYLRCLSYGASYDYKETCDKCRTEFAINKNLNTIKTIYLEDGFNEPISYKLPVSGDVIEFRLMRGKDEMRILNARKEQNNPNALQKVDTTLSLRYELQLVSVNSDNDKLAIRDYIKTMVAGDSSALRQYIDKVSCGIDITTMVECPNCQSSYESEVPVSESFFRTSTF